MTSGPVGVNPLRTAAAARAQQSGEGHHHDREVGHHHQDKHHPDADEQGTHDPAARHHGAVIDRPTDACCVPQRAPTSIAGGDGERLAVCCGWCGTGLRDVEVAIVSQSFRSRAPTRVAWLHAASLIRSG